MLTQDYRNMMESVTLSSSARRKIEAAISASHPVPHRFLRPFPVIVAAACMLVLLPLTVAGIKYTAKPVSLANQETTEGQASYNVLADVFPAPPEQFSEAMQSDLSGGTLQQIFHNKENLESYLGFSLADSPTLEEAGIVDDLAESLEDGFDLRPQLALDPSARYIMTTTDLEGNITTTEPDALRVSSHRVFHNMEVYLDAWIILDSVTTQQLENGILGENFPPITGWASEFLYDQDGNFILDEKGTPQKRFWQFTSADYDFVSTQYKMPNGNTATIVTARFREPDGRVSLCQYMGYFVENGILYSVRPYGIYDPTLDQEPDAHMVLTAALDTFQ